MDPNLSVVVALGAFFVWALLIWNRLGKLRAEVSALFAKVVAEAQRWRDLVPGLEQMARAHLAPAGQPPATPVALSDLAALVAAREAAQAAAAGAPDAFVAGDALAARAEADDRLAAALNRLLAAVEAHPQLQGDESLRQAARELEVGEDRLGGLRRSYNQAVASYNAALQAFPAVMFAGMLGFKPAAPLE